MTYKIKPIIIKTKTNLHVGDGSTNFDIVDKSVQRDTISKLPIINASSLKGALKDYMSANLVEKSNTTEELEIEGFGKIFGSDDKQHGLVKFLDSYLLFLPLRSNNKPFYYVTSKNNLLSFIEFYETLDCKYDFKEAKKVIKQLNDNVVIKTEDAQVEDITCEKQDIDLKELKNLFPENIKLENIAIFSDENFIDAVTNLPIIARNKVAKKEDKSDSNLWYEEIVPRETIFYTAMLDYNNIGKGAAYKYEKGFEAFYKLLQQRLIQVGANNSIGFGLCSFKEFLGGCNE